MAEKSIEELSIPRLREFLEATHIVGDEVFDEFEEASELVRGTKAPTLEFLSAYISRFEETRSRVWRRQWIVSRRLGEAKDSYHNKLRKSKKRGPMGKMQQLAYGEREAHYESEHVVDLEKVQLLERTSEELKNILIYIDKKAWWLQNMRQELRYLADQARYASGKDWQN